MFRDQETISTAITAAETGHLVFATLHTNSAVQTINRIVDSFEGAEQVQVRNMLSTSLYAVISQALLPRVGKAPNLFSNATESTKNRNDNSNTINVKKFTSKGHNKR